LIRASTADQRFPASLRLHRPEQFEQVLKGIRGDATGAVRHRKGRWFALAARPNGLNHNRLGIIAARRVLPLAVARNRHKRLIREAFRRVPHGPPGLDLVVRIVREAADAPSAREELMHLISSVSQ
jgi:ribonuclease P protein component